MGKLLGILFGTLLLGPIAALLGFLGGFAFDSFSKLGNFNYSFNFGDQRADDLLVESFPILASYLSLVGGIDKKSVLVVKQTAINLFGVDHARIIMRSYKKYIEEGVYSSELNHTCHILIFNLTAAERLNYFLILVKMFRKMKSIDSSTITYLITLSRLLNISFDVFSQFGYNFQGQSNYRSYENLGGYQRERQISPYEVFQLERDASREDIKKQYRKLSKKYHPDITQNLPKKEREEAQQKMRELNSAYEQLKKERSFK